MKVTSGIEQTTSSRIAIILTEVVITFFWIQILMLEKCKPVHFGIYATNSIGIFETLCF